MRPGARYLLTIAVVSGATLAYEVLLLRLFSIVQWHHFAFMIISLALLGYGVSGVLLALTREFISRHYLSVILCNLLLLAWSMPLCFMAAQALPFNPAELLWDPWQLLFWLAVYLLLAIPFLFAANIIGLSFYQFRQHISVMYGADLLGAATGSVAIIACLFLLRVEQILLLLPVLLLLLGLMLSLRAAASGPVRYSWQAAFIFFAALMLAVLPAELVLKVSPYKSQSQLLNVPDSQVVDSYSSPQGLLSVVDSPTVPLRHAPGLSISSSTPIPKQLALFNDGGAMQAITRFQGALSELAFLGLTTSALPYHLAELDEVLILGAGAGSDVLQARLFGATQIDAVEQNPQIISLLQQDYAGFAGDIYQQPQVTVHQSEARAFVSRADKQYQLINLSMLDAAGGSSGLYSMTESYLFTVEAMQQYLSHLQPGGYLSLTRRTTLPPRDMPRLVATAVRAMQNQEAVSPSQRLILIRSWQAATLLVKNGEISPDEIANLKRFCQQHNFDLAYYPGIEADEVNHYHRLKQPYFYQAAAALTGPAHDAFIDDYKFNIKPATDDQPYFAQFFKWRTFPEIVSLLDQGSIFLLESGFLLLLVALVQALLASALLLLMPLWLWQRRSHRRTKNRLDKKILLYFFALGLAFLFVEIAFIQKFILILQHPVYAVTVVIASFLLSAGLGSYLSGRMGHIGPHLRVIWAVVAISLLSLLYLQFFAPVAAWLLNLPDWLRYLLAIALILPLGFCMGVPFPTALASLGQARAELIPWTWGVNGFASVISPIMATLIAMQYGFSVLIAVAVCLYLLVGCLFPRPGK
jgi:hypothetical protein